MIDHPRLPSTYCSLILLGFAWLCLANEYLCKIVLQLRSCKPFNKSLCALKRANVVSSILKLQVLRLLPRGRTRLIFEYLNAACYGFQTLYYRYVILIVPSQNKDLWIS
jgi:hypothetical protein